MKKMLKHSETASLQLTQTSFPQARISSFTVIEAMDGHPENAIKGDLRFCVSEQEVIRGPITGHYRVETEGLQEPLCFLWRAQNGVVLHCHARSTEIAFDLRGERTSPLWIPVILEGARTGQLWTSVLSVQVIGADARDSFVNGTFVQILVTGEDVLEEVA